MHARVWTHKALAFAYHQGSSGFSLSLPLAPSSMGEAVPSVPGGLKGSMHVLSPPTPSSSHHSLALLQDPAPHPKALPAEAGLANLPGSFRIEVRKKMGVTGASAD